MDGPPDAKVVEAQIGRPLRAGCDVVCRCHLGLPVVTAVPPILDTGEPFPTSYWLGCPLAQRRISRIEAAGGVREAAERAEREPEFAQALADAHRRYAQDRDRQVPATARHKPQGGVGGARRGVKCLHAHYADSAAGNANPVGELMRARIEPLNCNHPCVLVDAGGAHRNADWQEPPGHEA